VFGGFLEGEGLSNCEKYSISNDSWTTISPMPSERFQHVAAVRNEEIIVLGGANSVG
jgi:hypothetical protein